MQWLRLGLEVLLCFEDCGLDGFAGVLDEVGTGVEVGVSSLMLLDFGNSHLLEQGLDFRSMF